MNADTGRPVGDPLKRHTDMSVNINNALSGVAFSPDGRRLAGASADFTVRIWPATATPKMLCGKLTSNMSHQQWREWVSVSPDIPYIEVCPDLLIAPD